MPHTECGCLGSGKPNHGILGPTTRVTNLVLILRASITPSLLTCATAVVQIHAAQEHHHPAFWLTSRRDRALDCQANLMKATWCTSRDLPRARNIGLAIPGVRADSTFVVVPSAMNRPVRAISLCDRSYYWVVDG